VWWFVFGNTRRLTSGGGTIAPVGSPSTPSQPGQPLCGPATTVTVATDVDGEYALTVTPVDAAGNAGEPTTLLWLRATALPDTTAAAALVPGVVFAPQYAVPATATPSLVLVASSAPAGGAAPGQLPAPLAGFLVHVNGVPLAVPGGGGSAGSAGSAGGLLHPGPNVTAPLPAFDGLHTLTVAAVDTAGNRDPSPSVVQVLLALTPPGVVPLPPPALLLNTSVVALRFGAVHPGVAPPLVAPSPAPCALGPLCGLTSGFSVAVAAGDPSGAPPPALPTYVASPCGASGVAVDDPGACDVLALAPASFPDGRYHVTVTATSVLLATGPPVTVSFDVDTAPPVATLAAPAYFNATTAAVAVACNDVGMVPNATAPPRPLQVQVLVLDRGDAVLAVVSAVLAAVPGSGSSSGSGSGGSSGGSNSTSPGVVPVALAGNGTAQLDFGPYEGPVTLVATCVDAAGNPQTAAPAVATAVVDVTRPVIALARPLPAFTRTPVVQVCVTVTDASPVTFAAATVTGSGPAPVVLPLLPEAPNGVACANFTFAAEARASVHLDAVDAAGNAAVRVTSAVAFDATPPTVVLQLVEDGGCTVREQPSTFVDVCRDDSLLVTLSCADPAFGASPAACVTQWALQRLPDVVAAFDPASRGLTVNGTGAGAGAGTGTTTASCNSTAGNTAFRNATANVWFKPLQALQVWICVLLMGRGGWGLASRFHRACTATLHCCRSAKRPVVSHPFAPSVWLRVRGGECPLFVALPCFADWGWVWGWGRVDAAEPTSCVLAPSTSPVAALVRGGRAVPPGAPAAAAPSALCVGRARVRVVLRRTSWAGSLCWTASTGCGCGRWMRPGW
jgi:hypothetical protein